MTNESEKPKIECPIADICLVRDNIIYKIGSFFNLKKDASTDIHYFKRSKPYSLYSLNQKIEKELEESRRYAIEEVVEENGNRSRFSKKTNEQIGKINEKANKALKPITELKNQLVSLENAFCNTNYEECKYYVSFRKEEKTIAETIINDTMKKEKKTDAQ